MSKTSWVLFLLAIFCGAGAGVMVTFTDNLSGAFLYTAFPFVAGTLFFLLIQEVARAATAVATKSATTVTGKTEVVGATTRHPRAA